MKADTATILNDPELLGIQEQHFDRLTTLFDTGKPSEQKAFVLCGVGAGAGGEPGDDPAAVVGAALDELAAQADALRDERIFRPLVLDTGIYGVHFVDRVFGMELETTDEDAQAMFLETPVGELARPDLDKSVEWQYAKALALAFVDAGVAVPLFVQPCLTSALNQAVNLYGPDFFISMLEQPEASRRDMAIINDVVSEMRRWYVANMPVQQLQGGAATLRCQPHGYGQIDGCTTQLISPDMYSDLVATLDDGLLSLYPHGGMIHICGDHTQHVPAWREMDSMRVVQLSGPSVDQMGQYLDELRDDQLIYVSPTAITSLRNIMEISRGERTVVAIYPRDLPNIEPEIDGWQP